MDKGELKMEHSSFGKNRNKNLILSLFKNFLLENEEYVWASYSDG